MALIVIIVIEPCLQRHSPELLEENDRSLALGIFSPSRPLSLILSSLPRLVISTTFHISPPLPSRSPFTTSVLPPSSLTTSDSISHSHLLVLFLSHCLSPSAARRRGSEKRISRKPREGSKALNDGIEFWLSKFGLLWPSEELILRQCGFLAHLT